MRYPSWILTTNETLNGPDGITDFLRRLKVDEPSWDLEMAAFLYDQLKYRAGALLRKERPDHTLQPTALVNEAFAKILQQERWDWQSRGHFFAVASRVMRQVLVDYARARNAASRGGGGVRIPLDDQLQAFQVDYHAILSISDALERLKEVGPRQAQITEMRFFGGMTEAEIAEALGLSLRTVKRDWEGARAWLHAELSRAPSVDLPEPRK